MITKTKETIISAEPGKQELFIRREFDAPGELVFRAFSDPVLLVKWLGPDDMEMTIDKLDNRSHGSWRFIHKDAVGNVYAFNGVIHEVSEPERIIRTFEFEDMPGHVSLEFLNIESMDENKSNITIHVIYKSVEDRDGHIQSGMEKGLQQSHKKLDSLLDELKLKNPDDIIERSISMTRTFDAPISMLWKVLTTPEYIREWWGPDGFRNTIEEMEVKQGGRWKFTMHGPDGTDYENEYVYREVRPQEIIVLDHLKDPKFTIVITLFDGGDRTRIHWQNIFHTVPSKEEAVRAFRADEGLKQNMEKLNDYLKNQK